LFSRSVNIPFSHCLEMLKSLFGKKKRRTRNKIHKLDKRENA